MSEKIILSLGSNVGNRQLNLSNVLDRLKNEGFEIEKVSSVYETEPVAYKDQDCFLNIAVSGVYNMEPSEFLSVINKIEAELGRKRILKYGPRTIDIDIIFFGGRIIKEEKLIIPHPEYKNRRFVLVPILEIEPDWSDCVSGKKLQSILEESEDKTAVNKLKDEEK